MTVTNFPQEPEPKTIVVCENYTATASSNFLPFSAEVEGYKYVSIFASYQRTTANTAYLMVFLRVQNLTAYYNGQREIIGKIFTMETTGTQWETRVFPQYPVTAPYLDFKVSIPNDILKLTIVLYCYN